jgi:LmbE family N-acetylglucosaminyl deacetylase
VRTGVGARLTLLACVAVLAGTAHAQRDVRGAVAIADGVHGFATSARVLMIGAHPDDEDTALITWLARGRNVETAYLSLTRGDGGQNAIGNELGVALGAIRTEELLAARRLDGGRQYFGRAFDFGFSKDSVEAFERWPSEQMLGDVVRVIRAFRPHVIVTVFSGTAADGHGHHVAAGVLAREAFEVSADSVRFPPESYGAAWSALKLYRAHRGNAVAGALRVNAGEFDVVRGRALGELAAESRTQHKTQAQGTLPQRGVQWNYVRRLATRVTAEIAPQAELSMFDGIDTSWTRFSTARLGPAQRALVESLPVLSAAVRRVHDRGALDDVVPLLATAMGLLDRAREESTCRYAAVALGCSVVARDLGASIEVAHRRAGAALLAAAGVTVLAEADREYFAFGDTATATLRVVNRGARSIVVDNIHASGRVGPGDSAVRTVARDSTLHVALPITGLAPTNSAWWIADRVGSELFPSVSWPADGARTPRGTMRALPSASAVAIPDDEKLSSWIDVRFGIAGSHFTLRFGPLEHPRYDPIAGEVRRPLVPVSAISLLFDRTREFVRVGVPVAREMRLRVRSHSTIERTVQLRRELPDGLTVDGLPASLTLAPLETRDLVLRVSGRATHGTLPFTVHGADRAGRLYGDGIIPIHYDHIRPITLARSSGLWIQGVDVNVPAGLDVLYVRGVSDDVAPVLQQLGLNVRVVDPEQFVSGDLARHSVLVLGPRVFARTPALASAAGEIAEFARRGGTVVVQYGQQEIEQLGVLPFPVRIPSPAQRVSREDAPVRVLDANARALSVPNAIRPTDFDGWVQERALYLPSEVDTAWAQLLEMNDPGEPPNRNALLVAPIGRGTYVYTTLSFLRQIPAGGEGAIRLFVNLLASSHEPDGGPR